MDEYEASPVLIRKRCYEHLISTVYTLLIITLPGDALKYVMFLYGYGVPC